MHGFKKKENFFVCVFIAFYLFELKKEKNYTNFMKIQTKLAFHLWENFAELHWLKVVFVLAFLWSHPERPKITGIAFVQTFHIDSTCNSAKYIIQDIGDTHSHTSELVNRNCHEMGIFYLMDRPNHTHYSEGNIALTCLGAGFPELIPVPQSLSGKANCLLITMKTSLGKHFGLKSMCDISLL